MVDAKDWMIVHADDHIDKWTGELNMTTLAEDCAFTLYDRVADEEEFELAYEVACRLEELHIGRDR
jgi:hypothetical protein